MILPLLVVVSVGFRIGIATSTTVPEIALLHDLNIDHDRRHLDAGLSEELEFLLKRKWGDIKLSLRENKRLNHNAAMHELVRESNGKTKMIKRKHIPLMDEKFYQDKSKAGSFSVRCELSMAGPCRRQLTGSLHIHGRNYDISPVPEHVLNQGMKRYTNQHGTPHYLNEAKTIDKRKTSPDISLAKTDEISMPPPERGQMADSPVLVKFAKTGSLHTHGRNYDKPPVPDNVLNQDMKRYTNQHGTPQYLNEAKTIDKRNIPHAKTDEISMLPPERYQMAESPVQSKLAKTGSLHIYGRNYDISPVPDHVLNQDMKRYTNQHETPHYLNEAKTIDKHEISMQPPERFQMIESPVQSSLAKTPTLNFVELLVVIDSFLYKRYYDLASPTGILTRDEVAELNIRRDYSLVVNAVSLRYESIEDPELQIFCTVAQFLIIKTVDSNFNLPEKVQIDAEGMWLTEGGKYLGDLRSWFNALSNPPDVDAVMVFTGTELISTDKNGKISNGVEGIAYSSAACWSTKVSLNEAHGSFFTTALIAAHELGHNLGSSHDGDGTSFPCSKSNNYIMSYLTFFYESTPYKINPWRFSRCSIEAMKKYIKGLGGNNCLIDFAYPHDFAEYQEHLSKLPGERHNLDAQCKLIQGKDSKLCESTDMGNICLVMKCLAPGGSCKKYTAARGTICGTDKWCIDGACVSKVPVPPTTTCEDRGHVEFSCSTLRNGYDTVFDFCHTWNMSCCKTCKKLMGCWDGTNSQQYTGFVTWTKNGRTCQSWTSQKPHKHIYGGDHRFLLDGSAANAENTCRDPDNNGTNWCYTTNEDIRWEYCDIPICDIDCYRKGATEQYKGTQCQAWSEQTPHTHSYKDPTKFPNDESIVATNNLCRAPSKDERPWCYTMKKNKRWDWCPVTRCD